MLIEIDQVAVDAELWKRCQEGDASARDALTEKVKGLTLYLHAMPVLENEVVVTLRQLDLANVISEVRVER